MEGFEPTHVLSTLVSLLILVSVSRDYVQVIG